MTVYNKIIEEVKPILEEHDFKVVEAHKNYSKFDSKRTSIIIAFDERENSDLVFVGEPSNDMNLLHSESLKDVFGYEPDQTKYNSIFDFLIDFLNSKGKGILTGDFEKLRELDNYEKRRSKVYADDIIKSQNIRHADQAWNDKNYLEFVKNLDLVDKESIPKSYKLKYKIAWDKIRGKN